jgi:hypothetical protein
MTNPAEAQPSVECLVQLVRPTTHDHRVHHPWRWLRERLPDWDVVYGGLPDGLIGGTDCAGRTIHLAPGMLQAQRRAVLDHEVMHAEAGDLGPQHSQREADISRQSAQRLIPLKQLLDAVVWAHTIDELADDCWVDVATMWCRLDNLTDDERAQVRQALAIRDYHEEGMP